MVCTVGNCHLFLRHPAGWDHHHRLFCVLGSGQLFEPSSLGWMGDPDPVCRQRGRSIHSQVVVEARKPTPDSHSETVLARGPSLVSCQTGIPAGEHLLNPDPAFSTVGLVYACAWRLARHPVAYRFWAGCVLPLLPLAVGELRLGLSDLLCPVASPNSPWQRRCGTFRGVSTWGARSSSQRSLKAG